MLYLKIAGWVANSVDPDRMLYSTAAHLGLQCLLRPVCPRIYTLGMVPQVMCLKRGRGMADSAGPDQTIYKQ